MPLKLMNADTATEQFVRLLMAAEDELFSYTFALLPNAEDVREVMQEAAIAMWKNFEDYDASRPFFPWASRFAYYSVLTFRRRRRSLHQLFRQETLQALAHDYESRHIEFDERGEALSRCVGKLPEPARLLLDQRYHQGRTVQEIAARTRRKPNTLYKTFDRIHAWLLACVERALSAENRS